MISCGNEFCSIVYCFVLEGLEFAYYLFIVSYLEDEKYFKIDLLEVRYLFILISIFL